MPPRQTTTSEQAPENAAKGPNPAPLRLEPQSELTAASLLANGVQKSGNGLLFRQASAVEVFADYQRKLVLAHAVLTNDVVQRGVFLGILCSSAVTIAGG